MGSLLLLAQKRGEAQRWAVIAQVWLELLCKKGDRSFHPGSTPKKPISLSF